MYIFTQGIYKVEAVLWWVNVLKSRCAFMLQDQTEKLLGKIGTK